MSPPSLKRSHAGELFIPWGLCYRKNGIQLISITKYCKKYDVPYTTVREWLVRKLIHGVYQKGKYSVEDVKPSLMYRNNCYNGS